MTTPNAPIRLVRQGLPVAPADLEAPEQAIWQQLVSESLFSGTSDLQLLEAAVRCLERLRKVRARIKAEGETVTDRYGKMSAHPLLAVERDANTSLVRLFRALRLDVPPQVASPRR